LSHSEISDTTKLLGTYVNGNYRVSIYEDGTRVRETEDDEFRPAYPESFDAKICNRCDKGCAMCHECSTPDGLLGNLDLPFIDTLMPYTEIAIGGGNPLSHPGLDQFLARLKERNVLASITVHVDHFFKDYDRLLAYSRQGLVHGIGVSVQRALYEWECSRLKSIPNVVVHTINGLLSWQDYRSMAYWGLKLLILGYKDWGRGAEYLSEEVRLQMAETTEFLPLLMGMFKVISFDNLALKQLDVRSLLTEAEWDEFYQGDDGQATLYVDLVKEEFARSSTAAERFAILPEMQVMHERIKS
jgi:hypothetical protein